MSKRKKDWFETHPLPESEFDGKPIYAPKIKSYGVASWCPTPDGSGKPEAVAIHVDLEEGNLSFLVRLKSRGEVNRMVAMLLRHADDVWPEGKA